MRTKILSFTLGLGILPFAKKPYERLQENHPYSAALLIFFWAFSMAWLFGKILKILSIQRLETQVRTLEKDVQKLNYSVNQRQIFLNQLTNSANQLKTEEFFLSIKVGILDRVNRIVRTKLWHFQSINISEIDEHLLSKLVDSFEQDKMSLCTLVCGLLVEGRIPSDSEPESCDSFEEYYLKRIHDAISFYAKAADDPHLRCIINNILWEIRTTTIHPSITERLASFDLLPPSEIYHQFKNNQKPVRIPSLFFFNQPKLLPNPLNLIVDREAFQKVKIP